MELSSWLYLERAGPVALQVKRLATKHDDLSLVPETHMVGKRQQTPASCLQHTHHMLNKQTKTLNEHILLWLKVTEKKVFPQTIKKHKIGLCLISTSSLGLPHWPLLQGHPGVQTQHLSCAFQHEWKVSLKVRDETMRDEASDLVLLFGEPWSHGKSSHIFLKPDHKCLSLNRLTSLPQPGPLAHKWPVDSSSCWFGFVKTQLRSWPIQRFVLSV